VFAVQCNEYLEFSNGTTTTIVAEGVAAKGAAAAQQEDAEGVMNGCVESEMPFNRAVPCAQAPCEVMAFEATLVGSCFSPKNLDCGEKKILQAGRCFSKTYKEYVLDKHSWTGECAKHTSRLTLVPCLDAIKACPTEAFYKHTPWGACRNTSTQGELCPGGNLPAACSGKSQCEVGGARKRTASCVTVNAEGDVVASTACTGTTMEIEQCTTTCYQAPVYTVKVVSACDAPCGADGHQTVTYAACAPGSSGCRVYPEVTVTGTAQSISCKGPPCDPCKTSICITANTLSTQPSDDKSSCQCNCRPGFTGSRCHRVVDSSTVLAALDASGKVCPSGIKDRDGACCDISGIDACGYCKGRTVSGVGAVRAGIDITGKCCCGGAGVFLTNDFTCCDSPDSIDECASSLEHCMLIACRR
jgi:hypothetical protein